MKKLLVDKRFHLVTIALVTLLAFLPILQNEFVIDDRVFIEQWEGIRSFDVVSFFKGAAPPGHEGVYRPVRGVIYAVYYQLFGTNPFGWHLHSLVVHLAATVLVYFIVALLLARGPVFADASAGKPAAPLTPRLLIPLITSLLFALHPIHTETITYIASSMDAIGIAFFFASFYLYLRKNVVASIMLALLAFFTNELTLTLPLLIVLYEFTFGKLRVLREPARQKHQTVRHSDSLTFRRSEFFRVFRTVAPYFIMAILYLFVRFLVLGITTRGPYLANSLYLTFLTMTRVFVKYMSLLLLPINQANNHAIGKGIEAFVYRDYRTEAIVAQTLLDPSILLSVAILAMLAILAIWSFRKHPLITFCLAWFFIALLPVAEIIPQGSMLNERMLYIPSFGFVLLLAAIAQGVGRKAKGALRFTPWLFAFSLSLLASSYGYLTFQRNFDWKNEITLWSKDVAAYPSENAYAYYQLGNAFAREKRYDEAIAAWRTSNKINTKFVLGLGSIAIVYGNRGRTDEAIAMYQKAIAANPTFWEGQFNLANIYLNRGMLKQAAFHYKKVLEVNPAFTKAQENLNYILSQ